MVYHLTRSLFMLNINNIAYRDPTTNKSFYCLKKQSSLNYSVNRQNLLSKY